MNNDNLRMANLYVVFESNLWYTLGFITLHELIIHQVIVIFPFWNNIYFNIDRLQRAVRSLRWVCTTCNSSVDEGRALEAVNATKHNREKTNFSWSLTQRLIHRPRSISKHLSKKNKIVTETFYKHSID